MSRLVWLFMCYLKNNKIYTGDLVFKSEAGTDPTFSWQFEWGVLCDLNQIFPFKQP